jgi:AraC-like DNA-binding protein
LHKPGESDPRPPASTLAERTFKRRFASARGITPIEYVQRLRIEDAKRRLKRTRGESPSTLLGNQRQPPPPSPAGSSPLVSAGGHRGAAGVSAALFGVAPNEKDAALIATLRALVEPMARR